MSTLKNALSLPTRILFALTCVLVIYGTNQQQEQVVWLGALFAGFTVIFAVFSALDALREAHQNLPMTKGSTQGNPDQ